MAGEAAGEDRRVVGERDRREPGHRAPLVRGAHLDRAGRRSAPRPRRPSRTARWGSRRRTGSRRRGAAARRRGRARRSRTTPSWPARWWPSSSGAQPRSSAMRGRDVDQAAGARHEPVVAHALARDHERRAGLHDAERAVLAAVAALVLPVVRGGVQHAQVGRRRMVEELRDVVERERVRVGVARRVRVGALGGRGRRAGRATGRRAGRAPVTAGALVAVGPGSGAAERRPRRRRSPPRTCRAPVRRRHHVDDRRQLRVEQHVERAVEVAHAGNATDPASDGASRSRSERDDPPDGAGAVGAVGDDVEVAVGALHRRPQAHAAVRAR